MEKGLLGVLQLSLSETTNMLYLATYKQEGDSFKISANMPYICSKNLKRLQKTIISFSFPLGPHPRAHQAM